MKYLHIIEQKIKTFNYLTKLVKLTMCFVHNGSANQLSHPSTYLFNELKHFWNQIILDTGMY